MEKKMMDMVSMLSECQAMNKYCFNACLHEEELHSLTGCIKSTVECAEICDMTLASISFEGDFTEEILRLCSAACRKCSDECRRHGYLQCFECAKTCRECADMCDAYLAERERVYAA